MLELDDKALELLRKIENENGTDYGIIKIKCNGIDKHFIYLENLLVCLEETQDNREYAEMKLKELANAIDGRE